MTTRELYKAIGVAGYESLACWRKVRCFSFALVGSGVVLSLSTVRESRRHSAGSGRSAGACSTNRHGSHCTVYQDSSAGVPRLQSCAECRAAKRCAEVQLHKELRKDRRGSAEDDDDS